VSSHTPERPQSESVATAGLGGRVVRASAWVGGLRAGTRLLSLLRTVVLARLLAPEAFGRFGLALLVIGALQVASNTGFRTALVRQSVKLVESLSAAWWVEAVRGAVLAALLWLAAPWLAALLNDAGVVLLLRLLAVVPLFRGLRSMGLVLLQRELRFDRLVVYDLTVAVLEVGVAILAAWILQDARALVAGLLVAEATRTALSYAIHPWRPQWGFAPAQAWSLFRYGRWVYGSNLLMYVATQGDDWVLARLLGTKALGFYQMAYRLANLITTELTHVSSRVMFPAYSKLEAQPARMTAAFLRVVDVLLAAALPAAVVFWLQGERVVRLVLGVQWLPIVPALQVLALAGLLRALLSAAGPVYLAVDKPALGFWSNFLRVAVLAALIWPLTASAGMVGAAWAVVAAVGTPFLLWPWFLGPQLRGIDVRAWMSFIVTGAAAAGFAGGLMLAELLPGGAGRVGGGVAAALGYVYVQWVGWRCGVQIPGGPDWRAWVFGRALGALLPRRR